MSYFPFVTATIFGFIEHALRVFYMYFYLTRSQLTVHTVYARVSYAYTVIITDGCGSVRGGTGLGWRRKWSPLPQIIFSPYGKWNAWHNYWLRNSTAVFLSRPTYITSIAIGNRTDDGALECTSYSLVYNIYILHVKTHTQISNVHLYILTSHYNNNTYFFDHCNVARVALLWVIWLQCEYPLYTGQQPSASYRSAYDLYVYIYIYRYTIWIATSCHKHDIIISINSSLLAFATAAKDILLLIREAFSILTTDPTSSPAYTT